MFPLSFDTAQCPTTTQNRGNAGKEVKGQNRDRIRLNRLCLEAREGRVFGFTMQQKGKGKQASKEERVESSVAWMLF